MSPDMHTPMDIQKTRVRHSRTSAWARLSLALLCVALACSNLLDVKSPDKINTTDLEDPGNANLLVSSALGDFDCAYGAYIVASGLMSGELMETTQTASRWSYDRRDVHSNESQYSIFGCDSDIGTYTPISTARFSADHALGLLEGWTDEQVDGRAEYISKAASISGYSRILLGEGFCAAAIDVGPRLTSQQIFEQAIAKFDTAVTEAQSAGSDSMLNLALVGRARAELDAGQNEAAATDAALVSSGFLYDATYANDPSRRNNTVVSENNNNFGVSVAPAYRNLSDPRVPVTDQHQTASDESTPLFTQEKYDNAASPIPLASYIEAQLILAEATGGSGAIGILNSLRSTVSLPPLASSGDPAVIKEDIASERARWLFLQGTHLFDVRRLGLPLVPAAGLPYSIDHDKGGSYGTETCMPIPDVEVNNNPNAGSGG
jgi:starch-binding outer membrane protein, SusD/RagB family